MFGYAYYRQFQYKMVTHARVFSLKPKYDITDNQGLFIASSMFYLKSLYGYENMCSWDKIKDLNVVLPVTSLGEIDFSFMDSFISELEQERISELNAYLMATGLTDYTLTEEEEMVLKDSESWNWTHFRYETIFNNIKQGRRLKKEDQKEGNIPFVMSGVTNNGVVGYISNPVAVFPENSITVDIFGNVFYRNFRYGAGDDTGVYWNTDTKYSKEIMLFFASSMAKSLLNRYSYGKKLRSSKSLKLELLIPSKNGVPDYISMELYIRAIQKLVIKDVVKFADDKITIYNTVVNKV